MIDIVPITNRGQITIPALLRRTLNLRQGKKVLVAKSGDNITLTPVKEMDVMSLYASVKPKGKSTSPDVALRQAKAIKARQTAKAA